MAIAPLRSMNGELTEGMTDGAHKKIVQNRGGFVEGTNRLLRREINDEYLNIQESSGTLPDGTERFNRGTRTYVPDVQY